MDIMWINTWIIFWIEYYIVCTFIWGKAKINDSTSTWICQLDILNAGPKVPFKNTTIHHLTVVLFKRTEYKLNKVKLTSTWKINSPGYFHQKNQKQYIRLALFLKKIITFCRASQKVIFFRTQSLAASESWKWFANLDSGREMSTTSSMADSICRSVLPEMINTKLIYFIL